MQKLQEKLQSFRHYCCLNFPAIKRGLKIYNGPVLQYLIHFDIFSIQYFGIRYLWRYFNQNIWLTRVAVWTDDSSSCHLRSSYTISDYQTLENLSLTRAFVLGKVYDLYSIVCLTIHVWLLCLYHVLTKVLSFQKSKQYGCLQLPGICRNRCPASGIQEEINSFFFSNFDAESWNPRF